MASPSALRPKKPATTTASRSAARADSRFRASDSVSRGSSHRNGAAAPSGLGWTTSSGHTTRSTGLDTSADAARWRSNTPRLAQTSALVFWGPPPCTAATSISPTACALGASGAAAANAITKRAAAAAGFQRRRAAAARAAPAAAARAVSSSDPKSWAVGARGPAAWPMATAAMGTPPKGQLQRSSSVNTTAAGKAP